MHMTNFTTPMPLQMNSYTPRLLTVSAVALLVTLASYATAQSMIPGIPGPIRATSVTHAGTETCGRYLQTRANGGKTSDYEAWIYGYLAAYNAFSTYLVVRAPRDSPTMLAYLDKHCRDRPLDILAGGAMALIGDLGGWRPKLTDAEKGERKQLD